jgi:hypothetical protein
MRAATTAFALPAEAVADHGAAMAEVAGAMHALGATKCVSANA